MKKTALIVVGSLSVLAIAGGFMYRKMESLSVAPPAPAASGPAAPADAGTAKPGNAYPASLLWRSAADGRNSLWRFNADGTPSTLPVWDVPPEWDLTHFVSNGWGNGDLAAWKHRTSGEVRLWRVTDGVSSPEAFALPDAGSGWKIAAFADVDSDLDNDAIWVSEDGTVAVWTLDADKVSAQSTIGSAPGWDLIATGDYNADGRSDLFWRKRGSESAAVWLLDGAKLVDTRTMADAGAEWTVLASAQFDATPGADLLWSGPENALVLWSGADPQASARLARTSVEGWNLIAAADMNADGVNDLLWQNPTSLQIGGWLIQSDGAIKDQAMPPVGAEWTATASLGAAARLDLTP